MTTFALKMVAVIAMLIDHAVYLFVPADAKPWLYLPVFNVSVPVNWYTIGRMAGRIAFPIFAFLIAEGYFHTSNIKKYLLRLAVFALIAELPYRYVICRVPGTDFIINQRNIIVTLLFGLIELWILDHIRNYLKEKPIWQNICSAVVIALLSALLILIHGSYSELGYALILMAGFFYCHGNKKAILLIYILVVGFLRGGIEFFAILAAPFLWFYNGEQGKKATYFFYVFYPGHLILLKLVQVLFLK